MCDGHDVGTAIELGVGSRDLGFEAHDLRAQTSSPESRLPNPDAVRVFIYDNYPGGIGFSAPLFQMHDELLSSTRRLIGDCGCANGCPGCVGPVGHTGPLAKSVAMKILNVLLRDGIGGSADVRDTEVQAF